MQPTSRAGYDLIERLTLEAANRGEAVISAVRSVFCGLVLLRFLAITADTPLGVEQVLIEVPVLLVTMLASVLAIVLARRGCFRNRGLILSSIADVLVCFVLLMATVLWPGADYRGLLRTPDIAAMLPIVFVSALRLTPSATVAGVLASFCAFVTLVHTDLTRNGTVLTYGPPEIGMVGILIASVGVATWAASRGARALVQQAGRESARLYQARQRLDSLLREHHDVRTLLSTAQVSLQLAQRGADCRDGHLAAVGVALKELSGFIEGVKGQAFAELAAIDGTAPCRIDHAVHVAAQVIRHRFPCVRLDIAVPPVCVEMVGADRSLSQVIFNLLGNACEGDGSRGASRVQLDVEMSGRRLVLHVQDDGPGFLPEMLSSPIQAIPSTKPRGGGMGLMLVSSLVHSSGGRLELANRLGGGASVRLHLPLSPT